MYSRVFLLVFLFGVFFTTRADEVLLNSGMAWLNVNILEDLETEKDITIFTSMKKNITLKKSEIAGIKKVPFDTNKKSELVKLNREDVEKFDNYEYNMSQEESNPFEETLVMEELPSLNDSILLGLPKMRLNAEGGYSYRTVKIPAGTPSELESYMSGLKSGYNLSIDLTYFFHKEYGITVNYSRFSASNSMENLEYIDEQTGESGMGSMEDNMLFSFFGLGVTQRKLLGNGASLLISNISMGKLSYNNDSRVIYYPLDIEGSTVALHGLFGLDFFISPEFALGGSISYLLGSLSKIKVNGTESSLSENENLNRFDFNVGIKYYFQ
jgi:hypothetical protein